MITWDDRVPSARFEPAHTRGRKEESLRTRGQCDLPLISTNAWTGGFEHHRIASRGIACRCLCMPTLTWVGGACPICRSDRTGNTRELGESKVDMKRVQTVCLRFEPSNPLTILRCTFDFVKSSRVARPVHARRRADTTAVPSRFRQPVGACRACAMSESCSRCTGIRIRAAVPRTPPP